MIKVVIDNLQYLIPAVALIIVQLIISHKNKSVYEVKQDFIIKEIKNDIARLEEKQDKHNSIIERMVKVEINQKAAWKKIDTLAEDIKDIRHHQ